MTRRLPWVGHARQLRVAVCLIGVLALSGCTWINLLDGGVQPGDSSFVGADGEKTSCDSGGGTSGGPRACTQTMAACGDGHTYAVRCETPKGSDATQCDCLVDGEVRGRFTERLYCERVGPKVDGCARRRWR